MRILQFHKLLVTTNTDQTGIAYVKFNDHRLVNAFNPVRKKVCERKIGPVNIFRAPIWYTYNLKLSSSFVSPASPISFFLFHAKTQSFEYE